MRPAFVGHPIVTVLLFVAVGVWIFIEVRQALNRRMGATNRDRGSLLVLRFCLIAGALLAGLAFRIRAATLPYSVLVAGTGLVLLWAGIGLRWWSFRTLGRYFTFPVMVSPDQPIIMSGPYRVLRHPSYAAVLLALAGIGISYGNWLASLALVLLPLVGLVNRIRVEEAALSSALGDRYVAYARRRKRMIPFVW